MEFEGFILVWQSDHYKIVPYTKTFMFLQYWKPHEKSLNRWRGWYINFCEKVQIK